MWFCGVDGKKVILQFWRGKTVFSCCLENMILFFWQKKMISWFRWKTWFWRKAWICSLDGKSYFIVLAENFHFAILTKNLILRCWWVFRLMLMAKVWINNMSSRTTKCSSISAFHSFGLSIIKSLIVILGWTIRTLGRADFPGVLVIQGFSHALTL